MAGKKFVETTGLSNVFSAVNVTGGTATLKSNLQSDIIDSNSILYITAIAADSASTESYTLAGEVKVGDKFIFAKGKLLSSASNLTDRLDSMDEDIADKRIELINLVDEPTIIAF